MPYFSEVYPLNLGLSEDDLGDYRYCYNRRAIRRVIIEMKNIALQLKLARKLDNVLTTVELMRPIILEVHTWGLKFGFFLCAANLLREVDYLIVEYWPYGLKKWVIHQRHFLMSSNNILFRPLYDDNLRLIPTAIYL